MGFLTPMLTSYLSYLRVLQRYLPSHPGVQDSPEGLLTLVDPERKIKADAIQFHIIPVPVSSVTSLAHGYLLLLFPSPATLLVTHLSSLFSCGTLRAWVTLVEKHINSSKAKICHTNFRTFPLSQLLVLTGGPSAPGTPGIPGFPGGP